jgi:hypothetical protein
VKRRAIHLTMAAWGGWEWEHQRGEADVAELRRKENTAALKSHAAFHEWCQRTALRISWSTADGWMDRHSLELVRARGSTQTPVICAKVLVQFGLVVVEQQLMLRFDSS